MGLRAFTWFRVQGSGFKVQSSGFSVQGSKFRVQGSGLRVQCSEFRVRGSRIREVPDSEFGVQGVEVWGCVPDSGFGVQGLEKRGFGVEGLDVEEGTRVPPRGGGRRGRGRGTSHRPLHIQLKLRVWGGGI